MTTTAKIESTELLQRARDLSERLRSRAADTAGNRRLSPETVAELKESGLLKVLQATRNGGLALGMREHLEVIATLAEGCGSTSWVVGVTHAHSWMMSHFPEAAQAETYGTDPDNFISAVIAPRGRAQIVDGGYRLNGVWPFASGSENSQWLFLGAEVYNGDDIVGAGEFLVPTSAVTFRDDWYVTGLAGTGSCSVEIHDLDVPAHRFLAMPDLLTGASPGRSLHDDWNIGMAGFPVLILALAGSSIGMARRALADFPDIIGQKLIAYTAHVQREHTSTHLMLAEAAAKIDRAHWHLQRSADDIERSARAGEAMPLLERARVRADCGEAVELCLQAVTSLWKATGGSGLYATNPLALALANLQAMSVHGGLSLEPGRELYGRVLLGLDPDNPMI